MYEIDEYVIDVLMRDLVGHDRKPTSFLVYLWMLAAEKRVGCAVEVSYQDLAQEIGVSKSSAQVSVAWLVRRKLLAVEKASVTAKPAYRIKRPWNKESQAKT